ncbi:hypothetical protein Vadar_015088 [Vaccinium darrowii]|uniref:Uncharacterized protein n=1 Tax=Vaccinium darrowii TaxID=229202 RepID=A0ACB7Y760_9ERIC|nr:hypothetical protein Vadar_015088 [Vaccinium darrowii]
MAGWSKIADGSALDSLKTIGNLQKPDFCSDIEPRSKGSLHCAEEDKLRCLFDQLLGIFLKQICGNDSFRPLPPMIGDGQSVDLFKLYLLVREKGGYDSVSKNGLWDSVAQESGLGSGVGSAVKLVYVNYLDRLDRRLREIVKGSHGSSLESGTNPSGALMELESQFTRAFPLGFSHLDSHSIELDVTQNVCNGNGNMISDASTVEVSDRKRKRECHQQMLKWVVQVAKNPCNPEVGSLPERSKWKCYGTDQLWKQVLLAREAIFPRRHADVTNDQANSYWMVTMNPIDTRVFIADIDVVFMAGGRHRKTNVEEAPVRKRYLCDIIVEDLRRQVQQLQQRLEQHEPFGHEGSNHDSNGGSSVEGEEVNPFYRASNRPSSGENEFEFRSLAS